MDYPKSDPTVGLVGGKFTDGNPGAGVAASRDPSSWANGVTDEILNVLGDVAIVPDETNNAQLLGAIRTILNGTIGSVRNGRMVITAASAIGVFTADQIVVSTSLSAQSYRLAGYNQQVNLGIVGAGGMDVGVAPASGFVAIYAIYNPATKTSSILATDATAAAAPPVYAGANMPAGYTASALISVWGTNASRQLNLGAQADRSIAMPAVNVLSSSTVVGTITPVATSAIPKNAKAIGGTLTILATTGGGLSLSVYGASVSVGQQINNSTVANGGQNVNSFSKLLVSTPQTLYYATGLVSASGPTFIIAVSSYEF